MGVMPSSLSFVRRSSEKLQSQASGVSGDTVSHSTG